MANMTDKKRDPATPESTTKTASWPLGIAPDLSRPIPDTMLALTLHRDDYGAPCEVLRLEHVATPRLGPADAAKVLVSILATGPNFNTNFAALGLPVPVFGRGDSATLHIPGSDALGIVVDAGAAVSTVKVGQAVILDSWTGGSIRGYETHDGFHAQFAMVDEQRAIPVPPSLGKQSPEQLAALLLTYGTAYRAVVERLEVSPGDSLLVMGGGKGTSFAAAQLGKSLGARVILMGSNPELGQSLIERGMADAFVNRRRIPKEVFGVLDPNQSHSAWLERTQPFRDAVFAANDGQPVDAVFEHTGGKNFPLLASTLADGGRLAFFGATGQGLKGEYKETFFYDQERRVLDARWVWMRQKQVVYRNAPARDLFDEIALLPGRRGLVWGADEYSREFIEAALERDADLAVVASHSREAEGIAALLALGIADDRILDRDQFQLGDDMPDPLTEEGTPNDAYMSDFLLHARALGKAIWGIFGPRVSPDFVVERPDQSTLHFSTFVLRDFDETDAMPCGYVVARGQSDLSILGSHMYRADQARETVRLLASQRLVMEQADLDIVALDELPQVQQKMLDGTMTKPKGVALVQAGGVRGSHPQRSIADYENAYQGQVLRRADPANGELLDLRIIDGIGLVTLTRPAALNALSEQLVEQLAAMASEVADHGTLAGEPVKALILRGSGRAFVAGADIQVFVGKNADQLEKLAVDNMAVFTRLEQLPIPVIALIDGFALGGGNELALSTHYRIATENAQLGQPEIKLGIIPGYGGMQRLPRLIGPRRAAEMSINGEPIAGPEALRIGLVHEVHPSSTALLRAFQVARDLVSGRQTVERSDWDQLASQQQPELRALLEDEYVSRLSAAKAPDEAGSSDLPSARSYAARTALEALRFGYQQGFSAGLDEDARLFGRVVASPSGQHWVGRFLAKDPAQSSFLTLLPPA